MIFTDDRAVKANRITWIGIVINVSLTLFKLLSGFVGKSGAIIADAVHSLSDLSTDIVVLWCFRVSGKPSDEDHDYGHGKVETLSSAIIGLALLVVGAGIFWGGAQEVYHVFKGEVLPPPGWIAFLAAVLSIISKEWLYRATVDVGKEIDSQAVIANAWHHRSDAFSSIGVMLGIGGAILLGGKWRILDPVAAITVSFFIIKMAIAILYESSNELIEASLGDKVKDEIFNLVRATPGAENPHNLRTRKVGKNIAIEIHIWVKQNLNITKAHDIATEVENKLRNRFGKETFVSVHVEPLK
jgi:cation diffusion facilitator family transporter